MEVKTLRPIALVTGASSGIGETYARLLAANGFDLWLLARRQDRLERICRELAEAHGVHARSFVCDLSELSQVQALCRELEAENRLEILVHTAGFGVHGEIGEADPVKLQAMVDVHVSSTVALCSSASRGLRERRKGAIVVVSSIAGWLTGSGSATYCATKAFETSFAISLARELEPFGVHVQALCPGYTRTGFHDTPEYSHWDRESVPGVLWSTAQAVVERSWSRLGKGVVCVPGRLDRLIVVLGRTRWISGVREWIRTIKRG